MQKVFEGFNEQVLRMNKKVAHGLNRESRLQQLIKLLGFSTAESFLRDSTESFSETEQRNAAATAFQVESSQDKTGHQRSLKIIQTSLREHGEHREHAENTHLRSAPRSLDVLLSIFWSYDGIYF